MKILLFGGTGAIGTSLVNILKKTNHSVVVTSRQEIESDNNITYCKGDAHDIDFLNNILKNNYDIIVDFMVYGTKEFEERVEVLLNHCKHYIFFSSCRVFAESNDPIKEDSERLVDVCEDEEYLETDEYALAKGREENILKENDNNNWTIIRPYITYNINRLQLGVYEKENWLWRALNGKAIVIPKDILERKTCVTYGEDLGQAIYQIIEDKKTLGEVFNIVNPKYLTWRQVLDTYLRIIEDKKGFKPNVKIVENSKSLEKIWNSAQIKYDRLFDRTFNSEKIIKAFPQLSFKDIDKLEMCLKEFIKNPKWLSINWRYEAWADKQEKTIKGVFRIPGLKLKIHYLKWRFFTK